MKYKLKQKITEMVDVENFISNCVIFLYETITLKKTQVKVQPKTPPIVYQLISLNSKETSLLIKIFGNYLLVIFLLYLITKDIFPEVKFKAASNTRSVPLRYSFFNLSKKKSNKLPRALELYIFCPYKIDEYVIFKEKHKTNPSSISINLGEIGKIIKKNSSS
jgi:hypothetical protein